MSKTSASFDKPEANSRALAAAFRTEQGPGVVPFDPKKADSDMPEPLQFKSSLNKKIQFMREVRQVSTNIQELMGETFKQKMSKTLMGNKDKTTGVSP